MEGARQVICAILAASAVVCYVIYIVNVNGVSPIPPLLLMKFINYQVGNLVAHDNNQTFTKKKLAILVPHRNCFEELFVFAPHMMKFLNEHKIPHHIYVMNQVDQFRFNRAALINVGYLYIKDKFDYLVIHDVDLLPLNIKLSYDCPKEGVLHLCPQKLHPGDINYVDYLGGILIVKTHDFKMINGMTNQCWGWGLEDDEFRYNICAHKLRINRPVNITTGKLDTFRHIHGPTRQRDKKKCFNQHQQTVYRVPNDGLNTTKYSITDIKEIVVEGAKVTVINVMLECNRTVTPWCLC